jgi:hypothetical protein
MTKLFKICQSNKLKLDEISRNQVKLENMLVEQKNQISELVTTLARSSDTEDIKGSKGKGRAQDKKKGAEFYKVNIRLFIL